MSWAQAYLGVPYVEKGRDRSGWDCWGMVRHILAEQRGLVLPSYTERYTTDRDRLEIEALMRGEILEHWTMIPLSDARPFDGVLIRILGHPIHCGLVVQPPFFLHAIRRIGTVMERWDSAIWEKRVLGAARWSHES